METDSLTTSNLAPCVPPYLMDFAVAVLVEVRTSDAGRDLRLTAAQGGRLNGDLLIERAWHSLSADQRAALEFNLNQTGIAAAEQALFTLPIKGTNQSLVEQIVTTYLAASRNA